MIKAVKRYSILIGALVAISACTDSKDSSNQAQSEQSPQTTVNQTLINGSPWATTALYSVTNGVIDRSLNYIDDSSISSGTISSAQYHDGIFMFVGMSDYQTGEFDEAAMVDSINAVANESEQPSSFSYGDYEVIHDGEGNSIRRITNASFAPTATIDRTITQISNSEFGYVFTASNGGTYYVEHKPYTTAFEDRIYPELLQGAVDNFFTAKNSQEKKINYTLRAGSPWATTAIYLQVNGEPDTSINYINDETISAGRISSAQYREGMFMFVGMNDHTTGEFDESALISNMEAVINGDSPEGFSLGDYEIILDEDNNSVRQITNASFAPNATINNIVTTATDHMFTYTFEKDGTTYYVEHEGYGETYPERIYPEMLQTAINKTFTFL